MRAALLATAIAVAGVLNATSLTAQDYSLASGNLLYGNFYPQYRHASTAAEGYLRGRGDLIRSQGIYNLATSRAMRELELAREQHIKNRVLGTQAYFQMRDINQTARDAEMRPRPTSQQIERLANSRAPKRLDKHQYDDGLHILFWPATFDADEFAYERHRIDEVMATRTLTDSGLGSSTHRELNALADSMLAKLKGTLNTLPSAEYMNAKNFLTGLKVEAAEIAAVDGLVSK